MSHAINIYLSKQVFSSLEDVSEEKTVWVLTEDVKNPKPDRRAKHDWRLHPVWKAGTRFSLRVQKGYMPSLTTGRWTSDSMSTMSDGWTAMAPFLQRANASLQEQINQDNIPEIDVFDKLIEMKLVTVEQVEDAIRLVRKDLNEESPRD